MIKNKREDDEDVMTQWCTFRWEEFWIRTWRTASTSSFGWDQ